MFSFHVEADLAILFEKLTAHIGARPGLETQLRFKAPSDLQVDIGKMQQLTFGYRSCPLENGANLVDCQPTVQKINKGLHLKRAVCTLCLKG